MGFIGPGVGATCRMDMLAGLGEYQWRWSAAILHASQSIFLRLGLRGEGGDEEDEGGMKPKDQGWVIRYLDKHPRLHKAQRASGGYLLMVLRL